MWLSLELAQPEIEGISQQTEPNAVPVIRGNYHKVLHRTGFFSQRTDGHFLKELVHYNQCRTHRVLSAFVCS